MIGPKWEMRVYFGDRELVGHNWEEVPPKTRRILVTTCAYCGMLDDWERGGLLGHDSVKCSICGITGCIRNGKYQLQLTYNPDKSYYENLSRLTCEEIIEYKRVRTEEWEKKYAGMSAEEIRRSFSLRIF